jgi:hypothetical protein
VQQPKHIGLAMLFDELPGKGAALIVPTYRMIGNEDMPRQRLANGWYELSVHPGFHNVP